MCYWHSRFVYSFPKLLRDTTVVWVFIKLCYIYIFYFLCVTSFYQMVGLYKDPQGENVFTGNNTSKGSTDQRDKSDSAFENTIATLKKRVIELETMLTQSQKQVCLSVKYSTDCSYKFGMFQIEGRIANHKWLKNTLIYAGWSNLNVGVKSSIHESPKRCRSYWSSC